MTSISSVSAVGLCNSSDDQLVCKECNRHVGNSTPKILQRSQDHLTIWRNRLKLVTLERDNLSEALAQERLADRRERRRLQAEIVRLTQEMVRGFSDSSPADIQFIMTQHVIRDAEAARDSAYHSRDRVYQLLWRLDGKHRPNSRDESCICGKRPCSVLDVIDDASRSDLYAWETRNIKRSKAGYTHSLPRDHPDYRDCRAVG